MSGLSGSIFKATKFPFGIRLRFSRKTQRGHRFQKKEEEERQCARKRKRGGIGIKLKTVEENK